MNPPGIRIDIRFDQSERKFAPGDVISGRVSFHYDGSWRAKFADVFLFWRTEGTGTRDEGIADGVNAVATEMLVSGTVETSFRFVAPAIPQTYYGTLVKIHWILGAYAYADGGMEGVSEHAIVIHPDPASIELPAVLPAN